MSYEEHQGLAADGPIRCAVITVSDTRDEDSDRSGSLIMARLAESGHLPIAYAIIPDEPEHITGKLNEFIDRVDVVIFNGGTGIAARDATYETLQGLFEKHVPGFGELFRMISYQEIGAGAMLTRAAAGLYRGKIIFSVPGSTSGVRLALDKLIIPELNHIVWELARQL